MKTCRMIGFGLLLLTVAFTYGCSRARGNRNRITTILSADTQHGDKPGTCDVDFPNSVLRKNKSHTVEWRAETNNGPFWIQFVTVDGQGIGHPVAAPLASGGVTITGPIKIARSGTSGPLDIDRNAQGPYKYDIWSSDPTGVVYQKRCTDYEGSSPTQYPCKCALTDQDTGVIVKP